MRATDSEQDRLSSGGASDISENDDFSEPQPEFIPKKCLFCNAISSSFDESISHMQRAHGLFIPNNSRLVVDLETLVRYLHLVVFGYHECLYCGTQRNSVHAVQQHMMGKGHCKFDVAREDSEFADFYLSSDDEGSGGETEESDDEQDESRKAKLKTSAASRIQLDDSSLRLPSGKVLSHRSAPQPRPQRSQTQAQPGQSESPTALPGSTNAAPSATEIVASFRTGALTKSERRESAFTTALSRLSVNDRTALMHLPAVEQRAVLATQKKQADKARRAEYRYRSRVEGMGNKTLMKHFVPDTPGRSNG